MFQCVEPNTCPHKYKSRKYLDFQFAEGGEASVKINNCKFGFWHDADWSARDLNLRLGVAFTMGEVRLESEVLLSANSAVNGTFLHIWPTRSERNNYDKDH